VSQRSSEAPPKAANVAQAGSAKTARQPFPWVTATVIVLSLLVAGLDLVFPELPAGLGELYTPLVVYYKQWWRVVTYGFVHGGPLHLGMNMLVAYQMGIPIERQLGSGRFLQVSLVTLLGGAAGVVLLSPATPVVGASGMILGWAGLIVPLLSKDNLRQFSRFLILNALISFAPGISWQGHLGGFLAGLCCGLVLRFAPQRFSTIAPVIAAATGLLAILGGRRAL
jgi:membrane associated rhomboid family serine protease